MTHEMVHHSEQNGNVSELVKAVCEVSAAVNAVGKDGTNPHHGYKYASVEGLVSALKPAMAKSGLALVPESVSPVTVEHGKTSSGKTWWRTDAVVRYRLYHISGASVVVEVAGSGVDDGDKGIYKCLSGALKYALCEMFMIPRLDDPDADSPAREVRPAQTQPRPVDEVVHATVVDEGVPYRPVIPFGKNKGKPLAELTPQSLNWYLERIQQTLAEKGKLSQIDQNLKEDIELELAGRSKKASDIHAKQMSSEEIPF